MNFVIVDIGDVQRFTAVVAAAGNHITSSVAVRAFLFALAAAQCVIPAPAEYAIGVVVRRD